MGKDIQYAIRTLRHKPGFALAVILTLSLGIGANTAIFSVVNAVLLRPLAYPRANRLMMLIGTDRQNQRVGCSLADWRDWRRDSRSFSEITAWVAQSVNLTGTGMPERLVGTFASAEFFKTLGVQPVLGRGFAPGDDQPGADPIVIVSNGFWRNRFGADPHFLGKKLTLNGEVFTVVGILSPGFQFLPADSDVYLPLAHYPNYTWERQASGYTPIARLKDGASMEQARAEMRTVTASLTRQYPDTNTGHGVEIVSFQDVLVEQIRPSLLALLGAVAFVLLIGCVNVANLLLTRTVARQRECAIRAALGASRVHLIRQLLSETVLLAIAGGGLGALLGLWGVWAVSKAGSMYLPSGMDTSVDATVLVFTLSLSLGTGLLVGLAPALQLFRGDWSDPLKEGARTGAASVARTRMRSALVVAEVALALMLLVGAGLMLKSFLKLNQVKPGFDPHNLLTLEYRIPRTKYPNLERQAQFHAQVVERVSALPGVESAAAVRAVPLGGNGQVVAFAPTDRPAPGKGESPQALLNTADPYYFRAMRIPLLAGRVITAYDRAEAPVVVVINQTMAKRYWPDRDPIGKQIQVQGIKGPATIIGVAADVKQFSLDDVAASQMYVPLEQLPMIFSSLVVRTSGDPMQMANAVRQAVWSVDKDQPVWRVRSMEMLLDRSVSPVRFLMALLVSYAGLALLLASVGIFGVIAYTVSQRTMEIGIRVAVGARPVDILRMVVGHGMLSSLTGVGLGICGAIGLTRFLHTLLFGVTTTDLWVYTSVSLLLALVALVACLIPARRATRIDPLEALRYE